MKHASQVALVYCADNQQFAQQIADTLQPAIGWLHLSAGKDSPTSLHDQLHGFGGPIILLISDNFLRSTMCMHQALALVNAHQHQLLPVVIKGYRLDTQTEEVEMVITSFERVSDIIQYINFWQDRYLDLRRQKREDPVLDEEGFNQHLKLVRDISSEAGEFLRLLRSLWHLSWEEFSYNDFEQLFIFLDDKEAWEAYHAYRESHPAAQPSNEPEEEDISIDINTIPGVSLLTERESQEPSAPTESTAEVAEESVNQPPNPAEPDMAEELVETPEEVVHLSEPSVTTSEAEAALPEEPEEEDGPLDEEDDDMMAYEPEQIPALERGATPVLEDENDQVAALIRKAWTQVDEGDTEKGITLLSAAIERLPHRTDLRYHFAVIQAQEDRDLDAAREQTEIILQADPENEDTLFLAAEIADMLGEPEHGRHYLEEVLSINSDYPDAWYRLGMLLLEHFPEDQDEALKAFKRAVKKDKGNAEAYYQLGLLYKDRRQDPKKAVKYLRKALKYEPEHGFAHYDLALAYHQLGESEKAHRAYQEAVALNPEFSTPENDRAFSPAARRPRKQQEGFTDNQVQEDTLSALKANIARLEQLLHARTTAPAMAAKKRPGEGRTALVSGATSGIGKATAEVLAEAGYRVIITGRRADRLARLKADWEAAHETDIMALTFDVRSPQAVEQAIAHLPIEWQHIDLLINNAGKAKGLDYIHEGRLEHWEEMIDTNIKGLLYLTRVVSAGMVKRGRGHIINVASTAGKEVYPRGNVYCATKHAVDALTRSMRIDLHTHGIRVSQVAPAHVEETEFALVRFDGDQEKAQIYDDFKPLTSRDVAETILYIARQPPHVNILDVVLQGTQQASSTVIDRSGRDMYEEEE